MSRFYAAIAPLIVSIVDCAPLPPFNTLASVSLLLSPISFAATSCEGKEPTSFLSFLISLPVNFRLLWFVVFFITCVNFALVNASSIALPHKSETKVSIKEQKFHKNDSVIFIILSFNRLGKNKSL